MDRELLQLVIDAASGTGCAVLLFWVIRELLKGRKNGRGE